MYSYSDTTSAVTWLRIEGSVPVQSLDLSTRAVSTQEDRRRSIFILRIDALYILQ